MFLNTHTYTHGGMVLSKEEKGRVVRRKWQQLRTLCIPSRNIYVGVQIPKEFSECDYIWK